MKMIEDETRFKQSFGALLLHARQWIPTELQHLFFNLKCLPDEIFPRAAAKIDANRQRIQEQTKRALSARLLRPPVRHESRHNFALPAQQAQHAQMRS